MRDFINKRSGLELGYFELLSKIDGRLEEPTRAGFEGLHYVVNERRYWIRHDVDDRIDKAWDMARAEHDHGIKSAYFFLNTAPYFRWGTFLNISRDFVKLGHTIGLHNNSVTAAYKDGDLKLSEKILKRDLKYLRKAGDVWITASHGSAWNRHYNVMNYEMFSECRRNGSFPHHPLSHYGLKYEAYFTPRGFYLSDSGGVWSSVRDINISLSKQMPDGEPPEVVIDAFNRSERGILQLLVHPEWWELKT